MVVSDGQRLPLEPENLSEVVVEEQTVRIQLRPDREEVIEPRVEGFQPLVIEKTDLTPVRTRCPRLQCLIDRAQEPAPIVLLKARD